MNNRLCATLFILSMLIATASLFPTLWKDRNYYEGAIRLLNERKSLFEKSATYESAWKYAQIVWFFGTFYAVTPDDKISYFEDGVRASEKAIQLQPDKPEGFFYHAASLGSLLETRFKAKGDITVASKLPQVLQSVERVLTIDPNYNKGEAYILRARLYHCSPAFFSIGDRKKAEQDYQTALSKNPSNRLLLRYYAEFLWEGAQKEAAYKIIGQALDLPYDPENRLSEDSEIKILNALLEKYR